MPPPTTRRPSAMTAMPPDELHHAPDDGMDYGWNVPAPCTKAELVSVLEDALARVRGGDSWEGTITWVMPTDEAWLQSSEYGLSARYRIGNSHGQSGVRTFTKPRANADANPRPNAARAGSDRPSLS